MLMKTEQPQQSSISSVIKSTFIQPFRVCIMSTEILGALVVTTTHINVIVNRINDCDVFAVT